MHKSIEAGGGMEALPGLKAITASSKMKKKTKTPVERLEILTKQFPPDATLVGHLWYTAAPSLHRFMD